MGFSDGPLFRSLIFAVVLGIAGTLAAQDGVGTSATMEQFALPEYKKGGGELQYIIYGSRAQNLGAFINLEGPILDVVRKNTNIFHVKQLLGQPLYPFGSNPRTVADFWKQYPTSDAILTTKTAVYDKNTKILRGDDIVELRSREMDLQGVGFDADFDNRTVHVRSKVKVIIRSQARERAANTKQNTTTQSRETK